MRTVQHYHINGTLHRSEVNYCGGRYLRIVRWVLPGGEIDPVIPSSPVWKEYYANHWLPVLPDKAKSRGTGKTFYRIKHPMKK